MKEKCRLTRFAIEDIFDDDNEDIGSAEDALVYLDKFDPNHRKHIDGCAECFGALEAQINCLEMNNNIPIV